MALSVRREAQTKGLASCAWAPVDRHEEYELGFAEILPEDAAGCGRGAVCVGGFDFSRGTIAQVGASLRSWDEPGIAQIFKRERPPPDVFHIQRAYRYTIVPHQVVATSAGLIVGADPDDDVSDGFKALVAERLRAFAAPVVGWPGPDVAARTWSTDEEAAALEPPIASLVTPPLYDAPARVAAEIRFRERRREGWGDAVVFRVALVARASSTGCPLDTREVVATGELVLRASNGEFMALHARGPWKDEEWECREPRGHGPPSPEPRTCNVGEYRIDVGWAGCLSPA